MLRHEVKQFVFSSTCATYGMNPKVPMAEDSAQDPCSPYARTKLEVMRAAKAAQTEVAAQRAVVTTGTGRGRRSFKLPVGYPDD